MQHTKAVKDLVRLALHEDLPSGDITSEALISSRVHGTAYIIAREPLVICGLSLIKIIASIYGARIRVRMLRREGAAVKAGSILCMLEGELKNLVTLERTILNFLQRLSGVASYTRQFVKSAAPITVLDTRKTTPGWRELEKYATRIGGAQNHRRSLSDMLLVKNNHIDANNGDIEITLQKLIGKKRGKRIEVEVRDMNELAVALSFKPEMIMLDNWSNKDIKRGMSLVKKIAPRTMVEVSGGITVRRVEELKRVGVKLISCGALTTQATNVDISMRVEVGRGKKR